MQNLNGCSLSSSSLVWVMARTIFNYLEIDQCSQTQSLATSVRDVQVSKSDEYDRACLQMKCWNNDIVLMDVICDFLRVFFFS